MMPAGRVSYTAAELRAVRAAVPVTPADQNARIAAIENRRRVAIFDATPAQSGGIGNRRISAPNPTDIAAARI